MFCKSVARMERIFFFCSFLLLVFLLGLVRDSDAFRLSMKYNKQLIRMCAPAKGGSTSLSAMVLETVSHGRNRTKSCEMKNTYLQDLKGCDWKDIPGVQVWPTPLAEVFANDIEDINHRHSHSHNHNHTEILHNNVSTIATATAIKAVKDQTKYAYSLLITRDPIERVVSSWESKIRQGDCTTETNKNHDKELGLKSQSFVEFVKMIYMDSLQKPNRYRSLQEHWIPQYKECGPKSGYTNSTDLADIDVETFSEVSKVMGLESRMIFPHLHHSVKTDAIATAPPSPSQADIYAVMPLVKVLYSYYAVDFAYYKYARDEQRHAKHILGVFSDFTANSKSKGACLGNLQDGSLFTIVP